MGMRLIGSFAFLSPRLLIVASAPSFFEAKQESDPPSLDIYTITDDGEGKNVRSLFFPEIACGVSTSERVAVRQLMIRSDPAPTIIEDPDHPYPFVLDPRHRLYIVTMSLEYESRYAWITKTVHFLIPSSTLFNNVPGCFGGEEVGRGLDEDLAWDDWGPAGTKFVPRDELPSVYVCYVYGMKFIVVPEIDLLQAVLGEDEDDHTGAKRKVTVYDFSPISVRREQARINPNSSHMGVIVDIVPPPSGGVPVSVFGQNIESSLVCVRRKTVEGHAFVSAMMDADNIILIKGRGAQSEDHDMEIWTM